MGVAALAGLVGLVGCGQGEDRAPEPAVATAGQAAPPRDLGYAAAGMQKVARPKRSRVDPAQAAAIAAEPAEGEVSLVFVGDTMVGPAIRPFIEEHGATWPFAATAPLLQQADLAVGNLEGVLVASTDKPHPWSQRADPSFAQALVWAGLDVVSLGNNHFADHGDAGVLETKGHLDAAGIGHFGVGGDPQAARAPWRGEVRGLRVALLGGIADSILLDPDWLEDPDKIARRHRDLVRAYTHEGGEVEQGAWLHSPESLAEDVRKAREVADLVIVDLHWGVILWRPPWPDQVALAEAATAAGADLVIGHHAHIWQPVALTNGRPVVYGLGNYVMGFADKQTAEGLVARAIVSERTRQITRVELFPLDTSNTPKRVAFRNPLLAGPRARVVLEDLAAWSRACCGTEVELRADRAVLHVPARASLAP